MIIRVEKRENPYVVIEKTALEDPELSFKAKGLIAYLLSKPDNWRPMLTQLINASKDGEVSIRNALNELEEAGYLVRNPVREKGKIVAWEQIIYEVPQNRKKQETLDFPEVENPHVGNPQLDNPALIINDKTNKEEINKESIYSIFEYWNSKGIIRHRELKQRWRKTINARLKHYTAEQIKEAIDNYATVLSSEEYYWTYRWTLEEFLKRGLDKFLTENKPLENYRKGGRNCSVDDYYNQPPKEVIK